MTTFCVLVGVENVVVVFVVGAQFKGLFSVVVDTIVVELDRVDFFISIARGAVFWVINVASGRKFDGGCMKGA